MSRKWDEFEKFEQVIMKYMEPCGEGETKASQAVTAVNKLVYKWYNDGDVFDNTGMLEGWANDLSSYANWLWRYMGEVEADRILEGINDCYNDSDYEDLLYELAEAVIDEEVLEDEAKKEKVGSIYHCNGIFKFVEYSDDEEEKW